MVSDKEPLITEASIKASSTSFPIISIKFSLDFSEINFEANENLIEIIGKV